MRTRRPSFIITGPRRAGKSTICLDILQYLKNNDKDAGGVITIQNSSRWMYLVRDDRKIRFEAKSDEEYIQVGKFRIHKANMQQALTHIESSLEAEFLFIDEIGILELNMGGFYPVLEKAFSRKQGNIFVVRESIVENILDSFDFNNSFQIVRVKKIQYKKSLDFIKTEVGKCFS
ncbi:MAG: nucleoside-triphosphatase [Promethearchaeota archaeon]|jgi:nucleoside-triphosphatase THEP1